MGYDAVEVDASNCDCEEPVGSLACGPCVQEFIREFNKDNPEEPMEMLPIGSPAPFFEVNPRVRYITDTQVGDGK